MSELIYSIVMWTARIHDEIMGMNDGWGYYNSDKKLHFIVMGIIGMIVVLAAYFVFKLLQNEQRIDLSSALSVINFLIVLVVVGLYLWIVKPMKEVS